MKRSIRSQIRLLLCCIMTLPSFLVIGQATTDMKLVVDVVVLKDGSQLSGTILKWELARGMEFKLITGAQLSISREEIARVYQDIPFTGNATTTDLYQRAPRPYAFKEEGWYNTFSVFLDFSSYGGAGFHYSFGYKFNRLLSAGIGTGFESHDFGLTRTIVPLYAEARGYFLPQKITPYYGIKIGYGFAQASPENGTLDAKGGFRFSPEIGVRFGGKAVNYYLGLEYLLQNATFTNINWWDNQSTYTDVISYRRLELRTGILF